MAENEDFRLLIMRICERISDLDSLKYQCKDDIGRGRMEQIKTPMDLFIVLEERDRVSAENVDFLITMLTNIRRKDLAKLAQSYKTRWLQDEIQTTKTFSDYEEPQKLNAIPISEPQMNRLPQYSRGNEPVSNPIASIESQVIDPQTLSLIHFVSERISHNWQMLARYLNVPDDIISQSIYNCHNVNQQIVESLSWWARHGSGSITELVNAASQCDRRDLVDAIQMNFSLH